MEALWEQILTKANYWMTIALMMVGLYAMITKRNLVKKIIGMNILQTAVILMFISIGAKRGATIPILKHGDAAAAHAPRAVDYINPLPHVLMLTAIVVAVSTLGVALALAVKIYQQNGTLDEADILARQVPRSHEGGP
ncbi:MAG: cation:proton antiporter subunit C [Desulfosarcinaceae bacterium]|nr:cation:proton antiporter subunit C [Desulfosarcinaceae bacterium]